MGTLSRQTETGWRANGWLDLALRWLLGGLFVMASAHKIMDPAAFAKIIFGYDLFPAVAINLIAIILPYIELTSGLALITGVYPRAAAVILSGLLFAFILAISINAFRGHVFDCGCFSSGEAALWQGTPAWMLGRNGLLLFMGWSITTFRGQRKIMVRSG
jgi:putative oxidoreductase